MRPRKVGIWSLSSWAGRLALLLTPPSLLVLVPGSRALPPALGPALRAAPMPGLLPEPECPSETQTSVPRPTAASPLVWSGSL